MSYRREERESKLLQSKVCNVSSSGDASRHGGRARERLALPRRTTRQQRSPDGQQGSKEALQEVGREEGRGGATGERGSYKKIEMQDMPDPAASSQAQATAAASGTT